MGVRIASSWGSILMLAASPADAGTLEYGLRGSDAEGKTRPAEAGVFRAGGAALTGEVVMLADGDVDEVGGEVSLRSGVC